MPGRKIPLVTEEFYHIYNRGVAKMNMFLDKQDYDRAIQLIRYYQNSTLPLSYSSLRELPYQKQDKIITTVRQKKDFLVRIHTFKLMPNHFHFTLEQLVDNGISKFMANWANSFTRYFNTRYNRVGPVYQGKFQNIHIDSDEQLMHLSRYHHLNAYTSSVVKTRAELCQYPYSSFPDYIGSPIHDFVETSKVLFFFKDKTSYKQFVLNRSDYQRKLHKIKHFLIPQP